MFHRLAADPTTRKYPERRRAIKSTLTRLITCKSNIFNHIFKTLRPPSPKNRPQRGVIWGLYKVSFCRVTSSKAVTKYRVPSSLVPVARPPRRMMWLCGCGRVRIFRGGPFSSHVEEGEGWLIGVSQDRVCLIDGTKGFFGQFLGRIFVFWVLPSLIGGQGEVHGWEVE